MFGIGKGKLLGEYNNCMLFGRINRIREQHDTVYNNKELPLKVDVSITECRCWRVNRGNRMP